MKRPRTKQCNSPTCKVYKPLDEFNEGSRVCKLCEDERALKVANRKIRTAKNKLNKRRKINIYDDDDTYY